MSTRNAVRSVGMMLVAVVGLSLAGGCFGLPRGSAKDFTFGKVKIEATGAGVVKADSQKTVYKVKCATCGYETFDITIETPPTVRAFRTEWTCPKCGHKQTIVVSATAIP